MSDHQLLAECHPLWGTISTKLLYQSSPNLTDMCTIHHVHILYLITFCKKNGRSGGAHSILSPLIRLYISHAQGQNFK